MVLPQVQGKGKGQRELTAVLTSGSPDGTLENGSPTSCRAQKWPQESLPRTLTGGLSGQVDC